MKPDPDTERAIAQTAFCWLDYETYRTEEHAIRAFRRRNGMRKFDADTVRNWLAAAVAVRKRLETIKAEIVASYGRESLVHLTEEEFENGTATLATQLNEEHADLAVTVDYLISMAWTMYYLR